MKLGIVRKIFQYKSQQKFQDFHWRSGRIRYFYDQAINFKLLIYIIIYGVCHVKTTNKTFCTFRGLRHKRRNS